VHRARTSDGLEYHIRPITPADAARERAFINALSPASRHARFMHAMSEPSADLIHRLVDVDGVRNRALVATIGRGDAERIIGVARYGADEQGPDCEFAVAVADDFQCRGVGTTLAQRLFADAARAGFRAIYGIMLADNARMLDLAEHLGLTLEPWDGRQPTVRAVRRLS
jgi:acetyltransferase